MDAAAPSPHPALVVAVLALLPALAERLAFAVPGGGVAGRSYRLVEGHPVVTLKLCVDPQGDYPSRDEKTASATARDVLRKAGLVVEADLFTALVVRVTAAPVPVAVQEAA